MKKWKKWLLVSGICLLVLGVGAKFAFDYAADKAMKQLVKEVEKSPEVKKLLEDKDVQSKLDQLKKDPNLQKDIEKMAGHVPAQESVKEASVAVSGAAKPQAPASSPQSSSTSAKTEKKAESKKSSDGIHFDNTSEAARYAMKRFSASEINYYRGFASGGLTNEEKKQIKSVILSRFSSEEIRAFIEVARR